MVPVLQIAVRRFNVLDREQVKARAEMAETEDEKIIAAVDYGARTATNHNTIQTSAAGYTRATSASLYTEVEQHNAPVANVIMSAHQYKDIRGWAKDEFDPVTAREMIKTGYVGDLWNAQIRVTKKCTEGKVYALADPEFMGVISVRIDLDQMDAPDQVHLSLGWVFYEYIGISVIIAQGVAGADITGAIS